MIPFPQIHKGETRMADLFSHSRDSEHNDSYSPVCSGEYYYEDRKDDRYPSDKGDITHVFVGPAHLKLETERDYILLPQGAEKGYFAKLIDLGGGGYYLVFEMERTAELNEVNRR
jgi:hypothetical protein